MHGYNRTFELSGPSKEIRINVSKYVRPHVPMQKKKEFP